MSPISLQQRISRAPDVFRASDGTLEDLETTMMADALDEQSSFQPMDKQEPSSLSPRTRRRMELDYSDPYGLAALDIPSSLRVSKHLMATRNKKAAESDSSRTSTRPRKDASQSPVRQRHLGKCHSEKALRVSVIAGGLNDDFDAMELDQETFESTTRTNNASRRRLVLDTNDPYGLEQRPRAPSLRVSNHGMAPSRRGQHASDDSSNCRRTKSKSPRRRPDKKSSEPKVSPKIDKIENDTVVDSTQQSPHRERRLALDAKDPFGLNSTGLASLRVSKHIMTPSRGANDMDSQRQARRGGRRMDKCHSEKALRVSVMAGGLEDDYEYEERQEDVAHHPDSGEPIEHSTTPPNDRAHRMPLDAKDPFGINSMGLASLRVSKHLMAPARGGNDQDNSTVSTRRGGRRMIKANSEKALRVSVIAGGWEDEYEMDEDDNNVDCDYQSTNKSPRHRNVAARERNRTNPPSLRVSKPLMAPSHKGQHSAGTKADDSRSRSPTRQARRRMEKVNSEKAMRLAEKKNEQEQADISSNASNDNILPMGRRMELDANNPYGLNNGPGSSLRVSKHLMAPTRAGQHTHSINHPDRSRSPQRPGRRREKERSETAMRDKLDSDGEEYDMDEEPQEQALRDSSKGEAARPRLIRTLSDRPAEMIRHNGKLVRDFLRHFTFQRRDES